MNVSSTAEVTLGLPAFEETFKVLEIVQIDWP